jgi:hypothetical protein
MLQITIPAGESWDEQNERFIFTKGMTLRLEHSLVSVSKWESKWHKPFLSDKNKTDEEIRDYIRCMTITQNVDPSVYFSLTPENISTINAYIEDGHTATTFREDKRPGGGREIITSELVYYWMIALNIPFECQTWHLNRLLTLVRICNIKSQPPKKRSQHDIAEDYSRINAERKKLWNTSG